MDKSEQLMTTIDLLNESGWFSGRNYESGTLCLGQALYKVGSYELVEYVGSYIEYVEERPENTLDYVTTVIKWNDQKGRTLDQVIILLTSLSLREFSPPNETGN